MRSHCEAARPGEHRWLPNQPGGNWEQERRKGKRNRVPEPRIGCVCRIGLKLRSRRIRISAIVRCPSRGRSAFLGKQAWVSHRRWGSQQGSADIRSRTFTRRRSGSSSSKHIDLRKADHCEMCICIWSASQLRAIASFRRPGARHPS